MARKKSFDEQLFERLHAQGLRKRVARAVAQKSDGRRQPAKAMRGALDDLKKLVAEVEDRASGGPAKRKAAAKKAARTRRANANARSLAAKKAARTRAKAKAAAK
jgi:hypothetical protein